MFDSCVRHPSKFRNLQGHVDAVFSIAGAQICQGIAFVTTPLDMPRTAIDPYGRSPIPRRRASAADGDDRAPLQRKKMQLPSSTTGEEGEDRRAGRVTLKRRPTQDRLYEAVALLEKASKMPRRKVTPGNVKGSSQPNLKLKEAVAAGQLAKASKKKIPHRGSQSLDRAT